MRSLATALGNVDLQHGFHVNGTTKQKHVVLVLKVLNAVNTAACGLPVLSSSPVRTRRFVYDWCSHCRFVKMLECVCQRHLRLEREYVPLLGSCIVPRWSDMT